ncbi:MAG: hypothetical protein ACREJI_10440 [Candidatus Methylomirabilales bacterium]
MGERNPEQEAASIGADAAAGASEKNSVKQGMKHTKPYGARRNLVMKKLIALGTLVATVAFGGTAFAGEGGGTLMDRELQKLFEWSAQAVQAANPGVQAVGPGAPPTSPVPPVLEHRGSTIK